MSFAWRLAMVWALAGAAYVLPVRAGEPPAKPSIYSKDAKAADEIAAAVQRAARRGTRVLLMFGADWCPWCHKLHELLATDEAIKRTLRGEYELVLVDTDKGCNADVVEKYGNPVKQGLPVLVVLDADGKQLVTQETGSLEEGDHHDPAKVRAFLEKHRVPRRKAAGVLAAALQTASRTERKVFVYFTAPWCAWCHRLDAFLAEPEVSGMLSKAFVPVMIDIERMPGGREILEEYLPAAQGVPYFLVLDATGKKLADSIAAEGNVGFPVKPHEVAHFLAVMRAQAPRLMAAQLDRLEHMLKAAAPAASPTPAVSVP